MSVNLSDAELAEASKCRRTVSVCTPSKRCKAGTLRLLPLKLTPIGARPYRRSATSLATGVLYGVEVGEASGVAVGVASGVGVGVASGVAVGVASGVVVGVASGVAVGVLAWIVSGVGVGVAVEPVSLGEQLARRQAVTKTTPLRSRETAMNRPEGLCMLLQRLSEMWPDLQACLGLF